MSPNVQPLQRYEIRPVSKLGDWAIVVIDVSRGYFSAVSSRGNYAHQWPETGFDFVRLLLEMERDWDYLHGKLMSGRRSQSSTMSSFARWSSRSSRSTTS